MTPQQENDNAKTNLAMKTTYTDRIAECIHFDGTEEAFEDLKGWLAAYDNDAIDQMTFHRGIMFVPTMEGVKTVKWGDIIMLNKKRYGGGLGFLIVSGSKRFYIEARGVCSPKSIASPN